MEKWFYQTFGEEFGPVSESELKQLIENQNISGSDKVKKESETSWTTVSDFLVAAPGLPAGTKSSDPDSQVSVGQTNEPADHLDINAFSIERHSDAGLAEATRKRNLERETDAAVNTTSDTNSNLPQPKREAKKKRKRKRKASKATAAAQKEDAVMEEIFSDVLNEDAGPAQNSPEPVAPVAIPGETKASGPADSPGPALPTQPHSSSDATATNRAASAGLAAAAARVPGGPAPKFKKSKSFGSGFSMPEPRTLGIAAGALVVVLVIVGLATGYISLPSSVDSMAILQKYQQEYAAMASKDLTESQWKDFGAKALPEIQEVIKSLESASDQKMRNRRLAARKFGELLKCKISDKKRRENAFEAFEALLQQS